MIGAYVDHRVARVGKIGLFEAGVAEQRPLEIAPAKIGFLKRPVAKIDLFGPALSHHQPLQSQTEKVAVIEDALAETNRIGVQQTLPIGHRPIDPDHLARDEIDIAHFRIGQLHQAQVAVFETAFDKSARGEKRFAEIARDEGAVLELRFGDLFAVQINTLEFLGEYVHVVDDGGHVNKAFIKYLSLNFVLLLYPIFAKT